MTDRHAIGIDLGGTLLRAATVDLAGRVLAFEVVESLQNATPANLIAQIADLAQRVRSSQVTAVGIGIPGMVDRDHGVVLEIPVFPGWAGVHIAQRLHSILGLPVSIENDASAAALGEWRFGAGKGSSNVAYVTVSTGIGGGFIVDGRLIRGFGGQAGEIGHTHVMTQTPVCVCGQIGCWQAVASGSALDQKVREAVLRAPYSVLAKAVGDQIPGAQHLAEAAQGGDPQALELLHEEATLLGIGFTNIQHTYSPERIVMGGGVSALLPLMRSQIEKTMQARILVGFPRASVCAATLGDTAGVIGVAALALDLPKSAAEC